MRFVLLKWFCHSCFIPSSSFLPLLKDSWTKMVSSAAASSQFVQNQHLVLSSVNRRWRKEANGGIVYKYQGALMALQVVCSFIYTIVRIWHSNVNMWENDKLFPFLLVLNMHTVAYTSANKCLFFFFFFFFKESSPSVWVVGQKVSVIWLHVLRIMVDNLECHLATLFC